MLRRLANDAMRSDPKAIKLLLALVDRYADSTEAKLQLGEMLAEDREILAQYLREPAAAVEAAAKADDEEERAMATEARMLRGPVAQRLPGLLAQGVHDPLSGPRL